MLEFLRKWWWPAFAFIYPLIFNWPKIGTIQATENYNNLHNYSIGIAFLGGAIVEILSHPKTSFSSIKVYFLPWLKSSPYIIVLLLLIGSISISSALSNFPYSAFMGTLASGNNSSLAIIGSILITILISLRIKYDETTRDRILNSIIACGVISAIIGIIEVILKKGLIVPIERIADVPAATFSGTGFLAGFLSISAILSVFYLGQNGKQKYFFSLVISVLCMGLSGNRASALALVFCTMLSLINFKNTKSVWSTILVVILLPTGWYINANIGTGAQNITRLQTISLRNVSRDISTVGIFEKPLLGWATNNLPWWSLKPISEVGRFVKNEYLYDIKGIQDIKIVPEKTEFPEGAVLYFTASENGKKSIFPFSLESWTSHNYYIDFLVNFGFLGLFLYIILLIYALRNTRFLPASFALLCYSLYLINWYITIETLLVFWIILACSIAKSSDKITYKIGETINQSL